MRQLSFLIFPFFCFFAAEAFAQEPEDKEVFSFREFLAMVKKHHPVVSRANLKISEAEAKLLKARGAYDPKVDGSLNEKNYKNTEYYELWDGTFKVPVWYGVDLKANYFQTDGSYLNPQNNTPDDGLWSAGISVNVLEGMIYNNRMNMVRKAKILNDQNEVRRNIQVNSILAKAARAYAQWVFYYQNKSVYENFLENAKIRFQGIVSSTVIGETPPIDTVETKIAVDKRKLQLQESRLNLQKARLYLSNFLWIDEVPVQLEENLRPSLDVNAIFPALNIEQVLGNTENMDDHPEIQVLDYELEQNRLDIRLRQNNLLPDINVDYNFLNEQIDDNPAWNTTNYKAGVSVTFPLFLRKERGELRLAKIKRENTALKRQQKRWNLTNKIKATQREIISLRNQVETSGDVVENNRIMVRAEIRLFQIGESSVFLVNTRENKLIQAQLKLIEIKRKLYYSAVKLFENLRLNWN